MKVFGDDRVGVWLREQRLTDTVVIVAYGVRPAGLSSCTGLLRGYVGAAVRCEGSTPATRPNGTNEPSATSVT